MTQQMVSLVIRATAYAEPGIGPDAAKDLACIAICVESIAAGIEIELESVRAVDVVEVEEDAEI